MTLVEQAIYPFVNFLLKGAVRVADAVLGKLKAERNLEEKIVGGHPRRHELIDGRRRRGRREEVSVVVEDAAVTNDRGLASTNLRRIPRLA